MRLQCLKFVNRLLGTVKSVLYHVNEVGISFHNCFYLLFKIFVEVFVQPLSALSKKTNNLNGMLYLVEVHQLSNNCHFLAFSHISQGILNVSVLRFVAWAFKYSQLYLLDVTVHSV